MGSFTFYKLKSNINLIIFRSVVCSVYCYQFVSVVESFFYSIFLSDISPILISWSWNMVCFWTHQNPLSASFIGAHLCSVVQSIVDPGRMTVQKCTITCPVLLSCIFPRVRSFLAVQKTGVVRRSRSTTGLFACISETSCTSSGFQRTGRRSTAFVWSFVWDNGLIENNWMINY